MIIILFLALLLSGCVQDPWERSFDQQQFNSLTYDQQQRELDRRAYLQGALGPSLLQGTNQGFQNMQQPYQRFPAPQPYYQNQLSCTRTGPYTSCY